MPKLLATGFEPFNGYSVNPSDELVKTIDGRKIAGYDIVGATLPLDYTTALDKLEKLLAAHNPQVILCCGQASRATISIERIAINALGTKRADNYGNTPETDVIDVEAPAAYYSNIDPRPLVEALKGEGIPAYVSYHAGTYGCNWILFSILHRIATGKIRGRVTFIHLPPLPSQALEKDKMELATMPLQNIVRAMEVVIQTLDSAGET
jgi:pyroglutamyl-peptidase